MKKVLLLNLLLVTALISMLPVAQAAQISAQPSAQPVDALLVHSDFSFLISSFGDDGTTIYYNPTAVQEDVTAVLTQLGACNVVVTVIGGIGDQVMLNPPVEVSFDSLRLPMNSTTGTATQANWKPVTLKGDSNGLLVQGALQGVQSHFEIRDLTGGLTSDFGGNQAYLYDLTTLFGQ